MKIDPIISYHNLDSSPAVEALVARRLAALDWLDERITGCEVTLEAPQ